MDCADCHALNSILILPDSLFCTSCSISTNHIVSSQDANAQSVVIYTAKQISVNENFREICDRFCLGDEIVHNSIHYYHRLREILGKKPVKNNVLQAYIILLTCHQKQFLVPSEYIANFFETCCQEIYRSMKKLNIPDFYRFNIKPLYNEVSVIVNKLPLSNYPSKVSLVNQIVKNAYKNDKSIESNILATYYNTIKK